MLLGQLRALPTHLQQHRGSEGAAAADPPSPAPMFTLIFGSGPADLATALKGHAGQELAA